ncbi:MAG: hypothetical protein WD981_02280 [Gaiellaceae bacterium]
MPETVLLTLVGDPVQPGAPLETEWEKPFADRPTVELDVEPDESLGSIVQRALEAFDVKVPADTISPVHLVDIGFHDDEADRPRVWDMSVVDEYGRAVWTAYDLRLVPFSQVLASAEAGVFPGDPRCLYIILREPIGNGLGIDWPTVVHAWEVIDQIVRRVGEYGGAVATIAAALALVRSRIRRGRDAIIRNMPQWSQRGARPYDVARLLTQRTWSVAELAGLLGCSEEDAEAVLDLFGFARSDRDGLWHQSEDDAARILAAAFEEAAATHFDFTAQEREEFAQRIEELVRTGEPPPERTYDVELDESQFFEILSLTLSPQGIVGQARVGGRTAAIEIPAETMGVEETGEFHDMLARAYRLLAMEIGRFGVDTVNTSGVDHAEQS